MSADYDFEHLKALNERVRSAGCREQFGNYAISRHALSTIMLNGGMVYPVYALVRGFTTPRQN